MLLDHFAACLFESSVVATHDTGKQHDERRLLLNFMLNNFDRLFTWTNELQSTVVKRQEAATSVTNPSSTDHTKELTCKLLVELVNRLVDDPTFTLKQKKAKLDALRRTHPDIYAQHFSDLVF